MCIVKIYHHFLFTNDFLFLYLIFLCFLITRNLNYLCKKRFTECKVISKCLRVPFVLSLIFKQNRCLACVVDKI